MQHSLRGIQSWLKSPEIQSPELQPPSKIILIITGPTAVGKTGVAIEAAKLLNGEIISADSRQIYRYMDIGTAKPTQDDLEKARHYCIDIKNPDETYSAGNFGEDARKLIHELHCRKILPILVGGSGLYLQAVLDGFFVDKADYSSIRLRMKQRLARGGLEPMYAELGKLDPMAHSLLAPNDTQRILRALEVAQGGTTLSSHWWNESVRPLTCTTLAFCLALERRELYNRIDQRVDWMVRNDLVGEVKRLVKMGYGRDCPGMATVGYIEILDYLEGKCSLKSSVDLIKRRSRRYAKRQLTWFRKDRRLRWLDLAKWGKGGILARVSAQYRQHCKNEFSGLIGGFSIDS